jgi:hypothetical protein
MCPMSRSSGAFSQNCVADGCMAWKWLNSKVGHDLNHWRDVWATGRKRTEKEAVAAWEAFHREEPLRGRCGMANTI